MDRERPLNPNNRRMRATFPSQRRRTLNENQKRKLPRPSGWLSTNRRRQNKKPAGKPGIRDR